MEKLDKERYLKRVIVVCWIALAICFGIKLFGGNLFEIMCENENFIKVCEYADNHFWAYYLVNVINALVLLFIFVMAVCQRIRLNKIETISIILTVLCGTLIKYFSSTFGLIFDFWQMFFMPALFTLKTPKKHWNILIGNILLVCFQFISLIVRNLGVKILTGESVLITLIFSIDIFLMSILYCAYSIIISKKGENKNGN